MVKSNGAVGFSIYDFPLLFNSKIWPLRDITLQNQADLSGSVEV